MHITYICFIIQNYRSCSGHSKFWSGKLDGIGRQDFMEWIGHSIKKSTFSLFPFSKMLLIFHVSIFNENLIFSGYNVIGTRRFRYYGQFYLISVSKKSDYMEKSSSHVTNGITWVSLTIWLFPCNSNILPNN